VRDVMCLELFLWFKNEFHSFKYCDTTICRFFIKDSHFSQWNRLKKLLRSFHTNALLDFGLYQLS
jgi:hypothetical protein